MNFENEQIVATVPTLELANTLRALLMRRGLDGLGPSLVVYVFHNPTIPDEYHIGIAGEKFSKVPEDTVLDVMMVISDFQEDQIREGEEFAGDAPAEFLNDLLIPLPPVDEDSGFALGARRPKIQGDPVQEG